MFSKKTIRIICLVTAIAMVVPICIGITVCLQVLINVLRRSTYEEKTYGYFICCLQYVLLLLQ